MLLNIFVVRPMGQKRFLITPHASSKPAIVANAHPLLVHATMRNLFHWGITAPNVHNARNGAANHSPGL